MTCEASIYTYEPHVRVVFDSRHKYLRFVPIMDKRHGGLSFPVNPPQVSLQGRDLQLADIQIRGHRRRTLQRHGSPAILPLVKTKTRI
jgi:hypothetical protein